MTLTNDAGENSPVSLAAGTEVDIVAWRPRAGDARYRVRPTSGGLEGWLASGNLRKAQPGAAPATGRAPLRAAVSDTRKARSSK